MRAFLILSTMSLIPRYYCDHCGHAFTYPKSTGWRVINDRDEFDDDERCPKCLNPDFELLIIEHEENHSAIAVS
jgi:hypothetical protein